MYLYIYFAWCAISDIHFVFVVVFVDDLLNVYIINISYFKYWCAISGICVCCLSIRPSVNLDRNIMPLTLQILV